MTARASATSASIEFTDDVFSAIFPDDKEGAARLLSGSQALLAAMRTVQSLDELSRDQNQSDNARQSRAEAVRAANASVALEGHVQSAEFASIDERFIDGDLSLAEYVEATKTAAMPAFTAIKLSL